MRRRFAASLLASAAVTWGGCSSDAAGPPRTVEWRDSAGRKLVGAPAPSRGDAMTAPTYVLSGMPVVWNEHGERGFAVIIPVQHLGQVRWPVGDDAGPQPWAVATRGDQFAMVWRYTSVCTFVLAIGNHNGWLAPPRAIGGWNQARVDMAPRTGDPSAGCDGKAPTPDLIAFEFDDTGKRVDLIFTRGDGAYVIHNPVAQDGSAFREYEVSPRRCQVAAGCDLGVHGDWLVDGKTPSSTRPVSLLLEHDELSAMTRKGRRHVLARAPHLESLLHGVWIPRQDGGWWLVDRAGRYVGVDKQFVDP